MRRSHGRSPQGAIAKAAAAARANTGFRYHACGRRRVAPSLTLHHYPPPWGGDFFIGKENVTDKPDKSTVTICEKYPKRQKARSTNSEDLCTFS